MVSEKTENETAQAIEIDGTSAPAIAVPLVHFRFAERCVQADEATLKQRAEARAAERRRKRDLDYAMLRGPRGS